jgi:hypothetical protein
MSKSKQQVHRSSVTGRFVDKSYANSHPATTETQHISVSSNKTKQEAYRDSVTGHFVSENYAKRNPKTTEKEHF